SAQRTPRPNTAWAGLFDRGCNSRKPRSTRRRSGPPSAARRPPTAASCGSNGRARTSRSRWTGVPIKPFAELGAWAASGRAVPELTILAFGLTATAHAAQRAAGDYAALLKALPQTKISLADGMKQAAATGEPVISAKFEIGDDGNLSLSVYTAAKGLAMDAEH